jgi:hypothetical protein
MYYEPAIQLPNSTEFRAYFFVTAYMIGIQAGIQAGHAATKMSIDYNLIYEQWATDDMTVVLLNAGFSQDELASIYVELSVCALHTTYNIPRIGIPMQMPVADFRESRGALNCALTAVSIIVPDRLYTAHRVGLENVQPPLSFTEILIVDLLRKYPMAR